MITNEIFFSGETYEVFYKNMQSSIESGTVSPEVADYTKLNLTRMLRLNDHFNLPADVEEVIKSVKNKYHWLVITEPWCGDSSQSLPIIAKAAQASDNIELRILYRDKNPEIMDLYLTNGTRSIPILVVFEAETLQQKAVWGPRPEALKAIIADYKANNPNDKTGLIENIHKWYAIDKGATTSAELKTIVLNLE